MQLLIVERNGLIAMCIEEWARDAGLHVVGPAPDLGQALELAESSDLDGAVLDIHLDGRERSFAVAAALRKRRVPFIFVTGDRREGLKAGFGDVPLLLKPFGFRQFVAAVRTHLMTVPPNVPRTGKAT